MQHTVVSSRIFQ